MDKEVLFRNLFKWLQTFPAAANVETIDDIVDGVVIANVLHTISPEYFDDTWLVRIKGESQHNWRLKVSNLKKILKSMVDYHSEILDQHFNDFQMPDISAIAESTSQPEMGRFLQLVLACAVNCDHKQRYIEDIMAMEESVQQVVMEAIQELMSKDSHFDNGTEVEDKLRKALSDCQAAIHAKEEMTQRCHELDMQISLLQVEKSQLQTENDSLLKRASTNLGARGSLYAQETIQSAGEPSHRIKTLQDKMDSLREELFKTDTAKEEFKLQAQTFERENMELKSKVESLWRHAEEARSLKDELDIVKERAVELGRYESAVEQYKRRVDETGDLKRQNKLLEEKNVAHLQKITQLEEDLRKSSALRTQLEVYKREIGEIRLRASDETKRADTMEFEKRRAEEKVEALTTEKGRIKTELESLKEKLEDAELPHGYQNSFAAELGQPIDLMSYPPEVRDRVLSLEKEVQSLRSRLDETGSAQEELIAVRQLLEDSKLREAEQQAENRISHQRILELTARVSDLETELLDSGQEQASNSAPSKPGDGVRVAELENELQRTQKEMATMEEKYKRYLEKARNVIRQTAINTPSNPGSTNGTHYPSAELNQLKNIISGKEKVINQMEKQHERSLAAREDEERLIVSAWYNLGVRLNREAAEDRLRPSIPGTSDLPLTGAGQSFLAKQRLVHARQPRPTSSQLAGDNSHQRQMADSPL